MLYNKPECLKNKILLMFHYFQWTRQFILWKKDAQYLLAKLLGYDA